MNIYMKMASILKREQIDVKKKYFPETVLQKKLPNINSRKKIGEFLTVKEEFIRYNDIYETFFKYMPTRLVYLLSQYGLNRKKVLDVGCGYGSSLIHFGDDSIGLEADETIIYISRTIGIDNILLCNVEFEDLPVEDQSFEAVNCSNLLEHIIAPHLLLRKIFNKLKDGGLLFLGVPLIPAFKMFEIIVKYFWGLGYANKGHINGFTRRTLTFTVQRAGFEILECGVFPFRKDYINKLIHVPLSEFSGQAVCIAKKKKELRKPLTYVPESIYIGNTLSE